MICVATILIYAVFNLSLTYPQEFEDIELTVYATIPVSDAQNKFACKKSRAKKLAVKN